MSETYIEETSPFLKTDSVFPLHDLYKKPYNVLRVESDGSIFSSQSSDFVNVYLSLRDGQLYLNWGFVCDGDNVRMHEFNMEFPYTGTITCDAFEPLSFENGHLVENESDEISQDIQSPLDDAPVFSEKDMDFLIHEFCSYLQKQEQDRKKYMQDLTRFFRSTIPLENQHCLSDEDKRDELYSYIHHDLIYVEDEYETVQDFLMNIAQVAHERSGSEEYDSLVYGVLGKRTAERLQQRFYAKYRHKFYATYSRQELKAIIRFWMDYAASDNHENAIPDEKKEELLSLANLVPKGHLYGRDD